MTLDDCEHPGLLPDDRPEPRAAARSPALNANPFLWQDPTTVPTRAWLYGHEFIRRFVTATIAPGGVGKTALSIAEALALASGRPLLGIQPPKPTPVWLFNLEDPREELERRIYAAGIHFGIDGEDLDGRLFVNSGRDTPCIIAHQNREGIVIAEPVIEQIVESIRDKGIELLIIDPFVSSHAVSENDNAAIDRVVKAWGRVAEMTGCAIHLIHHARKTGANEVTVEDSRGASALLSAARVGRVLNVMTKEEAQAAGVENPRQHFRVSNGKANLAPAPSSASWFRMESVYLGNGPDGHLGDSVGVVAPWEWPNALESITVADLRNVQIEIAKGKWRESAQSSDWVGRPIARVLNLDLDNPADRSKVKSLIRTWLKSGALTVVEGRDDKRNARWFVEVGEWAS